MMIQSASAALRTLPNGAYTDHTWDDLRLPASMVNKNAAGTTISQFGTFGYDGVFNMTQMVSSNNVTGGFNGTHDWGYDSKDRMTSEQNSGSSVSTLNYTDNFAYDSAGNPTTWKGASQSFNVDNQRSASGYAFDGNGNATTYGGGTLTYDPMDKLISLSTSGTASYRYRADGLRAWKGWNVSIPTSGGIPVTGATYYLYDGGNPVVEMDSSGTVTAINVFASDGLVARKDTGTWKYYQFDPQGSVAQRTNSSGTVVNSSMYDAYGKYVIVPFPASDVYGWNGRWGYYYDTDSGLYLCQQRYYDSNQGRWLNRDPIGYRGGINVYGYCGSGPVGAADPMGLRVLLGTRSAVGPFIHYYLVINPDDGIYKDTYGFGPEGLYGFGKSKKNYGDAYNYGDTSEQGLKDLGFTKDQESTLLRMMSEMKNADEGKFGPWQYPSTGWYLRNKKYNLFFNNCQDWVANVVGFAQGEANHDVDPQFGYFKGYGEPITMYVER